ncbi:MAG: phosphoenolpyruvate synthase [Synechococcales cyanobacterium]
MADIALVGGKNASLGEMIRGLPDVAVPGGFATTARAYRDFLAEAGLEEKLQQLFAPLDVNDVAMLRQVGQQARSLILQTPFSDALRDAIARAYGDMCVQARRELDVAVRSSATAEDLPNASFAGQQETYLNVRGVTAVLEACHRCFASLFTDRAISYRQLQGFDHLAVSLSVGVQRMVRSDLACSGVMFSIDTETGFREAVLITAAYGLGENVVQGAVNPDEYFVFKPTLQQGYRPILSRRLGSKALKMIYDVGGSRSVRNITVPLSEQGKFALSDDEVLQLARWAMQIEQHYGGIPMDMEWAKDGLTGELFIVQARPETVQSQKQAIHGRQIYHLDGSASPQASLLVTGRAVGERIGAGIARVILDAHHIEQFQPGEVLVTDKTDPDWEPIMKQASAIVTNQGGRTCHAAIIARELGIPAIVGTETATANIRSGDPITVSCAEGEMGRVYAGILPFHIEERAWRATPPTRTRLMINVANPDEAFSLAALPQQGVGLARLEFIIANQIQVHPLALCHPETIRDTAVRTQIEHLTQGYGDPKRYFIDRLAQGVGMIAAAFYPKPVVVRLSDFKSNEYANLLGGADFEPGEENPMIGWRGASRYYDPRYREGFALECAAMKRVREDMGLTNVILMIPFCRTPDEGRRVLQVMAEEGLVRGDHDLKVYVMAEIPSNVLRAAEFAEIFDGFSIGSNDLTQLTLGLDRDSARIADLFDERDPAVKALIRQLVATAHAHGRPVGICGQAPSDYPEFAEFLVGLGIDSISLNPDALHHTQGVVAAAEEKTV